jgi:glycine/D-amino acid oxidase-like deaminating enzyme
MVPPDAPDVPPDQGRSWWLREALTLPEFAGEPAPPLSGDTTADVVIVGGGYTGMWSAWFIKQLDPGADVVILEQDICGGGPSGRNGGFVNSFWGGLPHLVRSYGESAAVRLCEEGESSVRAIGEFCDEHGFDAWFRYDGELNAASAPAHVGAWADEVMVLDRLGLSDVLEVLSASEIRARIDSPVFHGGTYTRFGATVQPARLARGLRRVLMESGVRVFEDTPVSRFGAGSPVLAETPGGRVKAGAAVLAVNAWAQHWKRFRRLITVRGSYIVLTAPAPDRLGEIGWTNGVSLADYRAAVHYVRTTPDGRIAFGIGGMQPDLARRIDHRYSYDEASVRVAMADLVRMFPSFSDVPVEAAWGGPIDVSGLHDPFFGSFEQGTVHYGLGYTGNGVGPAHLGGRILAFRALGRFDEVLTLPLVDMEPRRFPPEPVRSPGAMIANLAILRRERALDEGREPNPFVDFVAKLPRRLGYNLGP